MRNSKFVRPTYAESFRCIGSDCEDTCCQGWTVPLAQADVERFQTLPANPLHLRISDSIVVNPEAKDHSGEAIFATIRMNAANRCPLLAGDGLCRIQRECGESYLPHTCATYPRIIRSIGGTEETSLTLSCPEAARLVLLNPELLNRALRDPVMLEGNTSSETFLDPSSQDGTAEEGESIQDYFWAIREFVLQLVCDRSYPLWQRLFLLGKFCRQMDSQINAEPRCGVSALLRDFEAAVASGNLRPSMDALPIDQGLQLDLVLQLAGMLLPSSQLHPRFWECIQAFKAGIGYGPGATFESLTAAYTLAHERVYTPFFERHPYILENYLINTILRCQFPFGREGMKPGASPSMTREHVLLTAQFGLLKGLLIGVAGFHGAAFSSHHVVHTVQGACKHFEHHVQFLEQAYALLATSEMEGERGAAILLRNADSERPGSEHSGSDALVADASQNGAGEKRVA